MTNSIFIVGLVALMLNHTVLAQTIGTVAELQGDPARVFRGLWQDLNRNDVIELGDLIRTRQSTRLLTLRFNDGSELALDANSRLEIQRYDQDGAYSEVTGRVRAVVTDVFSNRPNAFEIQTQTAIVGVQGTTFRINADVGSTRVEVEEGQVSVRSLDPNISGARTLTAGQFTIVRRGQLPSLPTLSPSPRREGSTFGPNQGDISTGSGATLDREADGDQTKDPASVAPRDREVITVPRLPTLPPF